MPSPSNSPPVRVVVLGGGFGGVYTAYWLQKLGKTANLQITLISRDNYFLMTPLLFEAGSGILEPRHVVNPIRPLFDTAKFVEAEIKSVDLDQRQVHISPSRNEDDVVDFDHLVLAMGGYTSTSIVPGSEHAMTFKNLGDAIFLRNHVISMLERADVEKDPARRKANLTFAIIGGGLVATELAGELTTFVTNAIRAYPSLRADEISHFLIEAGPKIAAEFDPSLAEYAAKTLQERGLHIRTNTRVQKIEPGIVHLPDSQHIAADSIILATGVSTSPVVANLPIEKDKKHRAVTDGAMRVKGSDRIWALGDCAAIPDPTGKPYPALAQHAMREAKLLAKNILAVMQGQEPQPFIYHTKGTLAALGHFKGIGSVYGFRIRGFIAWWVWRSYYLFQMPFWNRRIRILLDWTLALFFENDIVSLDFRRDTAPPTESPKPQTPG